MDIGILKLFGIWCLLFGIFLNACSKEDVTPPNPPILIPHGDDADTVETGIDAVPEGNWIYLEWRGNTEGDLAGYIVYRDTLPTPAFFPLTQLIQDTFYLDQNVTLGITYFYTVTAVDSAGNESTRGNTVQYALKPKPTLLDPLENELRPQGEIIFRWELDLENDGYFIVKVFSSGKDSLIQMSGVEDFFSNPGEFSDTLTLPSGSYRWRVDYGIRLQNIGSESSYRRLTLQ